MSDRAAYIGSLSSEIRDTEQRLSGLRAARDSNIRKAKAEGASLDAIASWSSLSKTQVQRICDLSKEGNSPS